MSESPEASQDRPTMAPFLGALALIVVVVTVVVLINVFSGDDLTDDQQIGRAAVAQNDALQRRSYSDFVTYTCGAGRGNEPDVLARQDDSVAKRGQRFVDGVTDVKIDGDRATAVVTYHFAKAPDAKSGVKTTFVREDGAWLVCSTGSS